MNDQQKKSFLTLIRLDAEGLFQRIQDKQADYLMILNFKRTREHFADIFQSKYGQISITDLKQLKESTIYSLDYFHREVCELKWYLLHTEDLPAMVNGRTTAAIKKLKNLFHEMMKNLDIEAGIENMGPPPLDFKD